MTHPIERFHNGDKKEPGILYRESRNFLLSSLVVFGAGLLLAAVGGVIINDYAFGWAATCSGRPMPFWPSYIGGGFLLVGGWLSISRGYAIATILDPFANGQALDARGHQAKAKPQPRTMMDDAADRFDEKVADKKPAASDENVIDGDWTPVSEMPA